MSWGHLLDLMPSPEGITVAEMQQRLDAALPVYTPSTSDNMGRLSAEIGPNGDVREICRESTGRPRASRPGG